MSNSRSRFWGMSGCLLAGLLIGQLANAAYLRQFSPQGQIDQQVRATAVFSADMAPLGKADFMAHLAAHVRQDG